MQNVPPQAIDECLPDCENTDYSVSISASPFRRCDHKTLGLSALCNFSETINPPIWGKSVMDEFKEEEGNVPSYVMEKYSTNMRSFVRPNESSEVFKILNSNENEYDAFKKDIAMATFFFDTTTAYEFIRIPKMTVYDFISQVGGMLGLCMGLSLVSIFEIFYWFIWNSVKISNQ